MAMRRHTIAHPDAHPSEVEPHRCETADRRAWVQRIIGAIVLWTAANIAQALDRTEYAACDRVDVTEINHYYNEHGRLIFDQIIYYDWNPVKGRYDVVDWRHAKTEGQIPIRNYKTGEYEAVWHDCKPWDLLRCVKARSIRETWTNYDPEQLERDLLPAENRRGLREPCAWGRGGESAGQAECSPRQNLHP